MGKLHELLAVEGDLKSRAQQAKSKILRLFTDGTGQLLGRVISYQVNEGEDDRVPEVTELATTVITELSQFQSAFGQWLDVAVQKEITNQDASSDVILDGEVVMTGIPATALLNLESKLAELQSVYEAIPTNDPSERWTWDEGQGQYVSSERVTHITKKVPKVVVLYEATKEHPAQVQAFHEDVKVGTRTITLYSGMLSPKEKRDRLNRIDKLIRAVKEARQRANDIVAKDSRVATTLFDYIEGVDLS